jgi:hypothetical protein
MLKRIFAPKVEEVVGSWRKLHKELHNLYTSPNIIKVIRLRIRWTGYLACMGETTWKT